MYDPAHWANTESSHYIDLAFYGFGILVGLTVLGLADAFVKRKKKKVKRR